MHSTRPLAFALSALLFTVFGLLSRAPAQQPGFVDEVYVSGFTGPVAVDFDGSGRMFVCERRGMVHVVENGVRQPTPLLDIRDEVGNWRDFGMLGFALDPSFLTTGTFYVMYVVDRHHLLNAGTGFYDPNANEYFQATIGRITRFRADPATGYTTLVPGSRYVLLGETIDSGVPILHQSHGIGSLLMGSDGTLLASTGDGASYSLVDAGSANGTYYAQALADGIIRPAENVGAFRSQMIGSLNGKILRLDPATGAGVASNPFFDPAAPRAARSRVYALGLRNPYRITRRPGTGATDPALGNPGDLYVGDVGWGTWEDVHVITGSRQNCGWPLFEGHTPHPGYTNAVTVNLDAPNPLFGSPGCTIPHFRFQDLIAQAQFDHNPRFANPCDPAVEIPSATPTFMHMRPVLDYAHGVDFARVPTFAGNSATTALLGSPASGASGALFRGNCSVGGAWHSGVAWPLQYRNNYYHLDYGAGWIRRIRVDATGSVVEVAPFLNGIGTVVGLFEDPVTHDMIYLDLGGNVRRVRYTNQAAPVADVAVANPVGGGRWVHLDGRGSSDPEGEELEYEWDFGDGTTGSYAAMSHEYPSSGSPQRFQARLEVRDPQGAFDVKTFDVHVDNTPPQVEITSFADGQFYSTTQSTTLPLQAAVSDAEHPASQLTFAWQVFLHHNNHSHPEAVDPAPITSAVLSPTPATGEFYAYRVVLTVTDPLGLGTTVTRWLLPENVSASVNAQLPVPAQGDDVPLGAPIDLMASVSGPVVRVDFYANAERIGTRTAAPFHLEWRPERAGDYVVSSLAVAADNSSSSSQGQLMTIRGPVEHVARLTYRGDDAEEQVSSGQVSTTSSDLELGEEFAPQLVGMRFRSLPMPSGSTITEAWIEFTADELSPSYAQLVFRAAAQDSAPVPTSATGDLSSRLRTTAQVAWTPGSWLDPNLSGGDHRTPDLAAVLQEVVDRPGWFAGNALMVLIDGVGRRTAESANGTRSVAPLLRVRYVPSTGGPALVRTEVRVAATTDDAEERIANGQVSVTSSDLEMTEDQGNEQLVGVRFGLDVPRGATIRSAHLQFTVDEVSTGAASLVIWGQVSDDAPAFASTPFDLSGRLRTAAGVPWVPASWPAKDAAGSAQRSPDLSSLVQEVIGRPGWNRGNHLAFLISGVGRRAAESYNGVSASAPLLVVEYQL